MYTIHHLPESERPRERLLQCGPDAMSNAELIAVILGSGTKGNSVMQLARDLTCLFGNQLADATIEELCQVKGMGKVKAMQLKAALTLGRRANKEEQAKGVPLRSPDKVFEYIKGEFENEQRECLIALFLDVKGCIICRKVISVGTLSRTLIHPREVFYFAVRHSAASVILTHNHPSGDPTPSKEDIKATENLIAVGLMMSIPVFDHIIVGRERFVSMRDSKILTFS